MEPKTEIMAFEDLGLFHGLDKKLKDEISATIQILTLSAGETLFRQRDPGGIIFCVITGSLSVIIENSEGGEKEISRIKEGEPVGELQVLTGGSRTATVRALTPVTLSSLSQVIFSQYKLLSKNLAKIIQDRLVYYRLQTVLPGLFGPLENALIQEIEERGTLLHLSRGEYLCRKGEQDRTLFILLSGRLMALTSSNNNDKKILGEISAGECVGEMALFTGEKRSADVLAIRDSQLISISETVFYELLKRIPEIGIGITKLIINRLKGLNSSCQTHSKLKNICLLPLSDSISVQEEATVFRKAISAYSSVYLLDSETVDKDLGTPGIANVAMDDPARIRLETYFNELESRYDIILFGMDFNNTAWSIRCVHEADRLLLLASDNEAIIKDRFGQTLNNGSTLAEPGKSLVILHESKAPPSGTGERLAELNIDSCFHIIQKDPECYARLARIITGNALGLVLSGGGAKGYAHAGVLKALEEAGIKIDMIGGTSMGSVIGAGYAMGYSPDKIIKINRALSKKYNPFKEYTLPIISLLAGKKLDGMLKEAFGERQIEDLWLSYFCVSSNLSAATEHIHKKGSLWKSVRASMSLPGILVPVIHEGSLLVDGGVVNNLPGDIMKKICPGTIITVDVAPQRDLEPPSGTFSSPWKILRHKLNPFQKNIKTPTILQILGRTSMLASVHRLNTISSESPYHLRPPVQEFGILDTDKAEEIAAVGYNYAIKIVDSWESLKSKA